MVNENKEAELELLDTKEASEFIRIPEGTLVQYRHRGRGPAYIRLGRHVRYEKKELKRWLYRHYTRTLESDGIPDHAQQVLYNDPNYSLV